MRTIAFSNKTFAALLLATPLAAIAGAAPSHAALRTGKVNKPGQPYGSESWKALDGKIMGKQVRLDIIDVDRYRRMVGIIWLDDRNINLEMLQEGYAEAYFESRCCGTSVNSPQLAAI